RSHGRPGERHARGDPGARRARWLPAGCGGGRRACRTRGEGRTVSLQTLPSLRSDLTIVRRQHRGRVDYIVKQPAEGKYYRFGEPQIALMRFMDGRRTPEDIAALAARELGVGIGAGQVVDFVQRLKRLGLVERTPAEQHLMLIERLRAERRARARPSILRLRFSIGDPDRLFTITVKRLAWLWSPAFVGGSLALFAA